MAVFDISTLRSMEVAGREFIGCSPPIDQRELKEVPGEDAKRKQVEQPGGCWHQRHR